MTAAVAEDDPLSLFKYRSVSLVGNTEHDRMQPVLRNINIIMGDTDYLLLNSLAHGALYDYTPGYGDTASGDLSRGGGSETQISGHPWFHM